MSVERCDPTALTTDWRALPFSETLPTFGSTWVREMRSVLLQVPSVHAYVEVESNYLINPSHPEASQIRVVNRRAFSFDPRLVRSKV